MRVLRKSADVAQFGTVRAQQYETRIRRVIPGYDTLHAAIGAILQSMLGSQADILVVGSGTGTEILELGRRNPGWHFTAVDPSPEMHQVAKERVQVAGLADRVRFSVGHVCDLPLTPAYDAATSVLVAQFLPDTGAKDDFYDGIAWRLRPEGTLITADYTFGEAMDRDLAEASWRDWALANGLSESEADRMMRRVRGEQHPVSVWRLCTILTEAGFGTPFGFFHALSIRAYAAKLRGHVMRRPH